jgi:hypothetical protein
MKKSILAAAGALLIGPFLVLSTPTAHAAPVCGLYDTPCMNEHCLHFLREGDKQAFEDCGQEVTNGFVPPRLAPQPGITGNPQELCRIVAAPCS